MIYGSTAGGTFNRHDVNGLVLAAVIVGPRMVFSLLFFVLHFISNVRFFFSLIAIMRKLNLSFTRRTQT